MPGSPAPKKYEKKEKEGTRSMKTVVITGSARGFGLCQAKKFKEMGFNVVVSDINEENLERH